MPIHHQEFCQDWTGVYEKDIAGNRMKRFFYDKWLTTAGVRLGLGPNAARVQDRASREEFIQAGCEMKQTPDSEELFNVKLHVRDTGAVVVAVQVPIFVRGHRYGAASCGWVAAEGQTNVPGLKRTAR